MWLIWTFSALASLRFAFFRIQSVETYNVSTAWWSRIRQPQRLLSIVQLFRILAVHNIKSASLRVSGSFNIILNMLLAFPRQHARLHQHFWQLKSAFICDNCVFNDLLAHVLTLGEVRLLDAFTQVSLRRNAWSFVVHLLGLDLLGPSFVPIFFGLSFVYEKLRTGQSNLRRAV